MHVQSYVICYGIVMLILLAAERGHVNVMKVLLSRGADVNTQDEIIMYRSPHYT